MRFSYWFRIDAIRKLHCPYGPHWRKQTVPFTRKRKYSWRGYRYPHTTQEIAHNAWANDEEARYYKIKRPRRGKLPTAWDDIPNWKKDRSWKCFRKTRYKVL
jgi:hypothetical protein